MVDKKILYSFCVRKWEELEQKDGEYNPERHDPIVLKAAGRKFGITPEEAGIIYDQELAVLTENAITGKSNYVLTPKLKAILDRERKERFS
ncbi:hypothetical protein [Halalkalibacter oceani]|uniref:hypothetical protein n=1 Tax=Halalkalibacter oceani TaxID=1653776 RepID=UPI0033998912